MDFNEVEELGKKIFDSCLKYVNNDLFSFSGKKLDVKYRTGVEKKSINAKAKVSKEGVYEVTVEMVTFNEIDKFYKTMLFQPWFFSAVTCQDEYDEKLAGEMYEYLFQYTIKLVMFHELGHIYNGHVDYIKKKQDEKNAGESSSFELRENCRIARDILSAIEWQAIEWNADDFAATRIVGQTAYEKNLTMYSFIKGREHAIYLDIIAVVVMYTIMGMSYESSEKEKKIYDKKEHLPYRFRALKYVQTLLDVYDHFYYRIDIDDVVLNAFVKRIEEWAIKYLIIIRGVDEKEWDIRSNAEELDEEHYSYYNEVDRYYLSKMYQQIKEYSYFPVKD